MNSAKRVNIFALVLVLLQVIAQFISGRVEKLLRINNFSTTLLFEILFLLVPVIIYIILNRVSIKETLRFNKISPFSILLVVGIAAFVAPIASFLNIVSQLFFHNFVSDVIAQLNQESFLELILIMAVTPAVCEEFALRGVILSGYKNININKAAIVNGLIFGILHMNPNQFVYAFAIGVVFSYIVYITNSIFASMICHFLFNAFSVTLSYAALKILPITEKATKAAQSISTAQLSAYATIFFVIAVICFPILLLLMNALQNENRRWVWGYRASNVVSSEKVMTWHIYAIIAVFIAFTLILQFIFKIPIFK